MKKQMRKISILKAIVGSKAYGTDTPESDIDLKGIYIQHPLEVLSYNEYVPQELPDKDTTYWEVGRFVELLCKSNPTVLELLFSPKDCVLEEHPLFKILKDNRHVFITKDCKNAFMGYAKQQIYKAKGLDKKMNWEKERIERKLPIDFCKFIGLNGQVIKLTDYLNTKEFTKNFFLTKIDNTKQLYKLWHTILDYKNPLCNNDDLLLTVIPENASPLLVGIVQYDLDGFQSHCREFNSYQTWLKERNETRYVDVKNHGQMIDGKNMLHCIRLIEMAKEIAETGEIKVRRPNAKDLLKIRKGELNLQELIDKTDQLIVEVEDAFAKSSLPDHIDLDLVNKMLKTIRKESIKYEYKETNTAISR